MSNYNWWGVQFIPSGASGYMKMLDGICQNVYTETGEVASGNIEYTCVSTDVAVPSWYNPETNQP